MKLPPPKRLEVRRGSNFWPISPLPRVCHFVCTSWLLVSFLCDVVCHAITLIVMNCEREGNREELEGAYEASLMPLYWVVSWLFRMYLLYVALRKFVAIYDDMIHRNGKINFPLLLSSASLVDKTILSLRTHARTFIIFSFRQLFAKHRARFNFT